MSKSEICFRQFKSYILWARGATPKHDYYQYYLVEARKLYGMYLWYKRIEEEPTEIIRPMGIAA